MNHKIIKISAFCIASSVLLCALLLLYSYEHMHAYSVLKYFEKENVRISREPYSKDEIAPMIVYYQSFYPQYDNDSWFGEKIKEARFSAIGKLTDHDDAGGK